MSVEIPENLVHIKKVNGEWVSCGDNYPLSPYLKREKLSQLLQLLREIGYERFYILRRKR